MEVVFQEQGANVLGVIKHDQINETFIPSFKPNSHDMFYKCTFSSRPSILNWKVENLHVVGNKAIISLSEADSTLSLGEFASSQSKNVGHFIKKYVVVEVEFGFYFDVLTSTGAEKINRPYGYLLPGEMHKRRPCIVLGESNGIVQVLPLSTHTGNKNKDDSVKVSSSMFTKLSLRYSKKPSYALLNMVQSVSALRVYPLANRYGVYEHKYLSHKLNVSDRTLINNKLTTKYNKDALFQLRQLEAKTEKLTQEKNTLFRSRLVISAEKEELEKKLSKLESFILKVGADLGIENDVEEVMDSYPFGLE